MSINTEQLTPTASNWFSTDIVYEGLGRAEFSDPPGIIKGQAKVKFDEFGQSSIEMVVERFLPEQRHPLGLFGFLNGLDPNSPQGFIGGYVNPCNRFSISTPEGVFSATNSIFVLNSPNRRNREGIGERLEFDISDSQFDVEGAGQASYWVLPLLNFVSNMIYTGPDLDQHPLRIYPTPALPVDLTDEEKYYAFCIANQMNNIISFAFNGELGFIERLLDYDERVSRLKAGKERNIITAIMVGGVGANSIDLRDVHNWLPFDFLLLLGLVSPTEVGAPWVEFRNAEGHLVRRLHVWHSNPPFSEGHVTIDESIHRATGHLLTRAINSDALGKRYIQITIEQLIRAGRKTLSMDTIAHVFRALEALVDEYKLGTQNLHQELDDAQKAAVKEALNSAAERIKALAVAAGGEGNNKQKEILVTIAERAKSTPTGKTRDFGLAVIALLNQFGLADVELIEKHYSANPRPDEWSWAQVISNYRALAIHTGYFSVAEGRHDIDDIRRIALHMYDLVVRIILQTLNYSSTYQPRVIRATAVEELSWVNADTPVWQLGY